MVRGRRRAGRHRPALNLLWAGQLQHRRARSSRSSSRPRSSRACRGRAQMSKSLGNAVGISEPPESSSASCSRSPTSSFRLPCSTRRSGLNQVDTMLADLAAGRSLRSRRSGCWPARCGDLYHGPPGGGPVRAAGRFDRVFRTTRAARDPEYELAETEAGPDGEVRLSKLLTLSDSPPPTVKPGGGSARIREDRRGPCRRRCEPSGRPMVGSTVTSAAGTGCASFRLLGPTTLSAYG